MFWLVVSDIYCFTTTDQLYRIAIIITCIFCLFGNGLLAIIVTLTVVSQSLILVFVQLISVIVTLFHFVVVVVNVNDIHSALLLIVVLGMAKGYDDIFV